MHVEQQRSPLSPRLCLGDPWCVWVLLQEKASLNLLVKPKLDKLVSHLQPRQLQAVVPGSAILPFPLSSPSHLNPTAASESLSAPGWERMEL